MDIYSKPDLYDAIHSYYSQDSQLITSIAKRAGDPVLELAAGTGRLAQLILDLGYNYTGLALSREFVDVACAKYGKQATFVLGDMQKFHLSEANDLLPKLHLHQTPLHHPQCPHPVHRLE